MDFSPNLERDVRWQRGWRGLPEAYVKIKVAGVSSIINDMIPDPGIEQWRKDVGEEAADKIMIAAQQRGTAMHLFIENWLIEMKKSGDPSAALKHTQLTTPSTLAHDEKIPTYKIDEGRKLFYNFIESDVATQYSRLLGTETAVYSPYLFYRGKVDWLFEQSLYGLSVRDFKTSSKPIEAGSRKEEGCKYQLGAYALALDHMITKGKKEPRKVNYASIVSMHTKSYLVQDIVLYGDELQEYKDKFETICKEYHIKHGQGFLIRNKNSSHNLTK